MGDDVQVGRMVQDLRISRNLRQEDLAARAGVSREVVSRLERGLADGLSVCALRAISRALAMPSIVSLGWRSTELDRLRDRLHAAMVEQVAAALVALGWEIAPEAPVASVCEAPTEANEWDRSRLQEVGFRQNGGFRALMDSLRRFRPRPCVLKIALA